MILWEDEYEEEPCPCEGCPYDGSGDKTCDKCVDFKEWYEKQ
jgi:hypothetical protein